MKLYEIDAALEALVDRETGEIADFEAFEALQMERDAKLENVGCWVKNLLSDAAAIKAEEKALAERRKALENKAESLKAYLARALGDGTKFSSPRVSITWRKSEAVNVTVPYDELSDEFLTFHNPEPNKTAIKDALKNGENVPGCEIVERQNMQIK